MNSQAYFELNSSKSFYQTTQMTTSIFSFFESMTTAND
ncbi:hypothetical protein SSCHL_1593 [Staphylococcus schleiferi]|nr:hypothetical protein SSCHL_1593 [Staphylococcus schleiferi]